jgi:hypothetical protein
MKTTEHAWQRLVTAARRAPDLDAAAEDVPAPPGFSTRIVALANEQWRERSLASLIDRFSWRALSAAAAVAIAMIALNFGPISSALDQEVLRGEDPVVALLDLS